MTENVQALEGAEPKNPSVGNSTTPGSLYAQARGCAPLSVGSLFAGIGGLDLGLERAGMNVVWQVESDSFCRRVLEKHWPNVRRHDDVCTFPPEDGTDWSADVICGGFPCQDISNAGERKGIEQGARSRLWFEMLRIIRVLRPKYVIVENVAALLVRGMGAVLGSLAEVGYDAEWQVLSAANCGAPHRRERVFIVAYPERTRLSGLFDESRLPCEPRSALAKFGNRMVECGGEWAASRSRLCVDDGIPRRMARRAVEKFGNAVVPQVALAVGRAVLAAHNKGVTVAPTPGGA